MRKKYIVRSSWFIVFFLAFFLLPTTNYKLLTTNAEISYTVSSDPLSLSNQKVCDRFEENTRHLSAVMDELRSRQGITETRVAFGGSDTPVKNADYWINFAAEAIAYQRVHKYSSKGALKSDLTVLQGKIVRAKAEVKKALNYYDKK